jgi:hypothetical protein
VLVSWNEHAPPNKSRTIELFVPSYTGTCQSRCTRGCWFEKSNYIHGPVYMLFHLTCSFTSWTESPHVSNHATLQDYRCMYIYIYILCLFTTRYKRDSWSSKSQCCLLHCPTMNARAQSPASPHQPFRHHLHHHHQEKIYFPDATVE